MTQKLDLQRLFVTRQFLHAKCAFMHKILKCKAKPFLSHNICSALPEGSLTNH